MSTGLVVTAAGPERPVESVRLTAPGRFPAAHARVVPSGYPSITSMLGSAPFYVAHRGGSVDWDEMTLRAYTNAVAWGAGALEVSLARTSDGVWFGLHDDTLDRTSGTSGAFPGSMTWAQVQEHFVFSREPYMRLEELTGTYGDTHVLFVDPKYVSTSHASELWALLSQAAPGWQSRRVVKLFWGFNSGWGAAAKAAGFTTWGYLWDDDGLPEILASSSAHANFDWLGLNYDASAGDWASLLALGKPVIGHVCPDATAASAALSKGAAGVMAASVTDIIPPALPWP